jgi:hypothetical protein
VAIKAAKGRAKQNKLTDSDGLLLLVLPSGARYWRMNYRHLGKYNTMAFGHPCVTARGGLRYISTKGRKAQRSWGLLKVSTKFYFSAPLRLCAKMTGGGAGFN